MESEGPEAMKSEADILAKGLALLRFEREQPSHRAEFSVHRASLFKDGDGDYTDVVIKCKQHQWKAHSLILATSCNFFRACLKSSFQEAETGYVCLDDDDPEACKIFLEFLYTQKLVLHRLNGWHLIEELKGNNEILSASTLLNLCLMADKYDVPKLVEAIADVFDPEISNYGYMHYDHDGCLEMLDGTTRLRKTPETMLLHGNLIECFVQRALNGHGLLSASSVELLTANALIGQQLVVRLMQHVHTSARRDPYCSTCGKQRIDWDDPHCH